jgi:hypothetical protein
MHPAMRCTLPVNSTTATVAAFGFHKAVSAQFGEHLTLNAAFLAPHRLAFTRGIRVPSGCLLALDALLLTGTLFSQSQPPFADAPPVTGWQSDRQDVPAARLTHSSHLLTSSPLTYSSTGRVTGSGSGGSGHS